MHASSSRRSLRGSETRPIVHDRRPVGIASFVAGIVGSGEAETRSGGEEDDVSSTFEKKLDNYADLAIRIGVALQRDQRLLLRAPVEAAPLARRIVEKAYQAGARLVEVLWGDDATNLARFQHAPRDSFDEIPTALADALLKGSARGDAVLSVYASDPTLLKDQDPDIVAKTQKDMQSYLEPFMKRVGTKEINWSIVAAPIESWAAQVFPDAPGSEAVDRLWDAIFRICRADRDDPISAWKEHVAKLRERRTLLNRKQYAALKYHAPGTDLTVGLPEKQSWMGGESHTLEKEIPFIANIPTEEVFAMPHKDRVDGVVRATKPLNYAGVLIEDFELRFQDGKVVEMKAAKNEAVLRKLIETDEGAARLGEVALVPHSSPISQSGLLFFNTLYDENASCHLALGRAYRVCVEGGGKMSDEEFSAAGGNMSLTHVDFMIGSGEMDIDGVTRDGAAEPLMRGGEWVS
ncbi:MAG: aminopeptidase [Candidatus Latescibacteria bacterium]|nr:aminopeptidase [Candidatus Latescibacterota bacterium]